MAQKVPLVVRNYWNDNVLQIGGELNVEYHAIVDDFALEG